MWYYYNYGYAYMYAHNLYAEWVVFIWSACREQFSDKSFDSKLDAVVALSCLLQGPTEIGNSVLNKPGVLEMLVALAESKETAHQVSRIKKCWGLLVFVSIVNLVLH